MSIIHAGQSLCCRFLFLGALSHTCGSENMQLHPFSVCFSNVLPSVLDHSAACLPSSVGELNEPEIVLVMILDAPRAEHCLIFINHTLLISFWCFSSKPPRRRHSVCLSQLFPWRQLLFQEVLAPFVFRQR